MTATGRTTAQQNDGPDGSGVAEGTQRLAEALSRLTHSTRHQLRLPLGVSTLSALSAVAAKGPMRLRDLAEHEGVTPATLSRIVAALEDADYARRRTDPADRRASFLEVTSDGLAVLDSVRAARAAVLLARVARLTPAQRTALWGALPALEALAAGGDG